MRRFYAAFALDLRVQWRNKLYAISIFFGLLLGLVLSWISSPAYHALAIPATVLMIAGGSTLLYVAGMILFEQDEGTLQALSVSPLTPAEYLGAKVLSLSLLACLEGLLLLAVVFWMHRHSPGLQAPAVLPLLGGLLAIGMLHTLIGIILVVRFQRITDFLVPMAAVAVLLQAPLLYFTGILDHPLLLLIPSAAQTLLLRGAFAALQPWEWLYAIAYTLLMLVLLAYWARRAFVAHLLHKGG
ncbi:MAG: hypothetical protein IGS03_16205 [Candidatus Sericytochromatia bacterium]|nr:hypothetical protein [Candidatus Sericytochromatia bacterium]